MCFILDGNRAVRAVGLLLRGNYILRKNQKLLQTYKHLHPQLQKMTLQLMCESDRKLGTILRPLSKNGIQHSFQSKIARVYYPLSIIRLTKSLHEHAAFFLTIKTNSQKLQLQIASPSKLPSRYQMRNNEIEDEKSVALSSFRHLESQKIVLPQNVFKSNFTWRCYETIKWSAFRDWLLSRLPLSVWWKCPPIGFTRLLFQFFPTLGEYLPSIHLLYRKQALSKHFPQFSQEITRNTPGTDTRDWEVIAKNLNLYLYNNRAWNTRYFFFDGTDCYKAFRTTLLKPFSLEKDDAAKNITFTDSIPYIEEALQVYFTQVDKEWHSINSQRCLPNIEIQHIQFSKHFCNSKLL